MILTTSLINTTVLRAFCALGAKAIKYYGGLAIGKNNTCLFKEMTLLRVYIDILKNFKIVGSEISCCCEIEGDYDTLLNNLSNATESPIQFNCDGIGFMLFNGDPYTFTYSYDEVHKVMVIKFDIPSISYTSYFDVVDPGINRYYAIQLDGIVVYSNTSSTFDDFIDDFNLTNQLGYTLTDTGTSIVITSEFGFVREDMSITQGASEIFIEETIVVGDDITETFNFVSFSESCNITSSLNPPNQPISPLKVATLDITGVGLQNEDYTITILDQFGNLVTTQTFSGEYLIDPDAVALQWNIQYGYANDWLMTYNGSEYVFTSPFTGINYEGYQISFSQTEDVAVPGIKASATGVVNFVQNTNLFNNYVDGTLLGGTTAGISSTPNSIALGLGGSIVGLGLGYTYSVTNNVITLFAPTVGTSFNGLPYQIKRTVTGSLNEVTFCVSINSAVGDTITITVNTDLGPVVIGTYLSTTTDVPFKVALDLTASINTGGTGFTAVQDGTCITISPPVGSGTTYVGDTVNADKTGSVRIEPDIQTFPGSIPASESFISFDLFEGGQDPDLGPSVITYNSVFEEIGSTTPFVNRNPCITRCHETSINIIGTGVPYYNDLVTLSVLNPLGNPAYSVAYPVTMTLQEIVDAWNADPNAVLYPATLDGTVISFKSCLPLFDAYPYKAELVQYEGGQDSNALFVNPIPQPFNTNGVSATTTIVVTGNDMILNSTTQNFNYDGNFLFSHSGQFTTPEEVETWFNTNSFDYSIQYDGPELGPEVLATVSNNFIGTAFMNVSETIKAYIDFSSYIAPGWKNSINYIGEYVIQPGDAQIDIWSGLVNDIVNRPAGISTSFILNAVPTPGDILNITYAGGFSVLGGPFTAGSYPDISQTAFALANAINSVPGSIWTAQANVNIPGQLIITLNPGTPSYGNYTSIYLIAGTSLGPSWSFENPLRRLMRNYIDAGGVIAPFDPLNPYQITLTALPGSESNWNDPNVALGIATVIGVNDVYEYFTGGQDPSPNGNYLYTVSSPSVNGYSFNLNDFSITYSSSPTIDYGTFANGSSSTLGLLFWELVLPQGTFIVHQDIIPENYASLQEIVDVFNDAPGNFDFTAVLQGSNINIISPPNTFEFYNSYEVNLRYTYDSPEYTNFIFKNILINGINPTREEYINNFTLCEEQPGSCMSTTVEQTCLSNDDVKKVITNINKIIK